jgi:uncharacterized membrane protein YsdA (DUF1294 family)
VQPLLKAFLLFYLVIAVVSVILTVHDKSAARKGAWRVPEATLMGIGFIGGALPMLITMKLIRHKTRHIKFMVGLPLEIILHVAIIIVAVYLYTK